MTSNNLLLYSHIASYLTRHFGLKVMEVIAARHLIVSLLTQLQKQTGTHVERVSDCMRQGFDALIGSRGLNSEHVAEAHRIFQCLADCRSERQSG